MTYNVLSGTLSLHYYYSTTCSSLQTLTSELRCAKTVVTAYSVTSVMDDGSCNKLPTNFDKCPGMGHWEYAPLELRMRANFAVLTPDGFHFWMTLSPQTSEPVWNVPVPPPGAKFWQRHCKRHIEVLGNEHKHPGMYPSGKILQGAIGIVISPLL